jgi:hypothetical protein
LNRQIAQRRERLRSSLIPSLLSEEIDEKRNDQIIPHGLTVVEPKPSSGLSLACGALCIFENKLTKDHKSGEERKKKKSQGRWEREVSLYRRRRGRVLATD